MNRLLPLAVLASFAVMTPVMAAKIAKKDEFSYAIGYQIGSNLKAQGIQPNTKILKQAIDDVLAGKEPSLSMKDMEAAVKSAQQEIVQKRAERGKVATEEGKKFLDENRKKKGITELKSGVQYEVIKEGKGEKPTPSDTIVVHYKGTLLNGTEFDSSYKRGQPITFGLNQMIAGWKEVLPLMPVGSKWKVYIPSELAYGQRGAPNIGPNETLVFEIELMEIKKKEAGAAGAPPHPMPGKGADPHQQK